MFVERNRQVLVYMHIFPLYKFCFLNLFSFFKAMWKYVIVKYDGIRPVNNVRKLELFRLKIFITRVPCVGTCVRLSLSTRVTWIEIPSRLCPWHSETLPHSCTYNHKKTMMERIRKSQTSATSGLVMWNSVSRVRPQQLHAVLQTGQTSGC